MNPKELKDIATVLADRVVAIFPEQEFQYDYLVNCLMEAIENAKR